MDGWIIRLCYLAGVLATKPGAGADHVFCDAAPVVVVAVGYDLYIHRAQHRGQVGAVELCHPPATHCAPGPWTERRQGIELNPGGLDVKV